MNFLDKLLMLIIAFSTILSLIFISMIIIDLNDTWNAINETMKSATPTIKTAQKDDLII